MKQIYFILLLLISINFSYQIRTIPEKYSLKFKCLFSAPSNIEKLISLLDSLFHDSIIFIGIKALTLRDMFQECLNIDLYELLRPFLPIMQSAYAQTQNILTNVQKYNAPLLLRKHLYDTAVKTDLIKAKKECNDITKMMPYDKYKNICNLFNIEE